jgi:hypothetical protein
MNRRIVGIDLGSTTDFTAVSVIERYGELVGNSRTGIRWQFKEYRVWHLDRFLGLPYSEIIERIKRLVERPELEKAEIVIDQTGVGRPIVDLLKAGGLKRLKPITITAGEAASSVRVNGLREFRVPKRDLVGALAVLLQNKELRIPDTLDLKVELISELQNFKAKIVADSGHVSYEHWRSGDHDDLVLSIALACWYAETHTPAFDPILL